MAGQVESIQALTTPRGHPRLPCEAASKAPTPLMGPPGPVFGSCPIGWLASQQSSVLRPYRGRAVQTQAAFIGPQKWGFVTVWA